MKHENKGIIMTEFVGLRTKMYSYTILIEEKDKDEDDIVKKAKGVKQAIVKTITFDDYKKCLFNYTISNKIEYHIVSENYEVCTVSRSKKALSWQDNKRQLLEGTTDTAPWGYRKSNTNS